MMNKDKKHDVNGHNVRVKKPYIKNHFLKSCVSGAFAAGHSQSEVLKTAGLKQDFFSCSKQLGTSEEMSNLIKSAWYLTNDEFLSLAKYPSRRGLFALMMDYALDASNLAAFLKRCAKFYNITQSGVKFGFKEIDGLKENQKFFEATIERPEDSVNFFIQEFFLLMLERLCSWLVSSEVPFIATYFNYSAPVYKTDYIEMFSGKFYFEQPWSGFVIHESFLQLPILKDHEQLKVFLIQAPENILYRPRESKSIASEIRSLLVNLPFDSFPSLTQISGNYHVSAKTLTRTLAKEGTNYAEIKSGLRKELALRLLRYEQLSVSEVSERTGFKDPAAFSRAFKLWTGCPPSTWLAQKNK